METEKFPPKELVAKCNAVIESVHRHNKVTDLPKRIATRENLVPLALLPDIQRVTKGALAAFKIRVFCWLILVASVALAWPFGWWILLIAVVAFVSERFVAVREQQMWVLQAAVLMSLEMLVNDFAGWGAARKDDKQRALQLLGTVRTYWLDLYLPRRSELDESLLKTFGPETA